ncbi:phospholipid scramblase 1-like [Lineus longissimus]|uniref:phospholipid scramblase 1-like n=1 Tax=Lineus longissimus TaxID=88925 RepID=UPI002B4C8C88
MAQKQNLLKPGDTFPSMSSRTHHLHEPAPTTQQPQPPRHKRMKKKSLSSFDPALHARPGIPRGLEYLSTLDGIRVYQYMDNVQATTCWVRSNKYRVCNDKDQQFFVAKDAEADEADLQCCSYCKPSHKYITSIEDNRGLTVIRLERTLSLLQDIMEVHSPPGSVVGHVKLVSRGCSCWPLFNILDADKNNMFVLQVPKAYDCTWKCCSDMVYKIKCAEEMEKEIGEIKRVCLGCKDVLMPSSDISVTFPEELNVLQKTLILAATLLIDYKYMENWL